MRSTQIHRAVAQGINRFQVCQLVAKGVRATHRTGSRFEDSINDVLQHIGAADAPRPGLRSGTPAINDDSLLKPAA